MRRSLRQANSPNFQYNGLNRTGNQQMEQKKYGTCQKVSLARSGHVPRTYGQDLYLQRSNDIHKYFLDNKRVAGREHAKKDPNSWVQLP